MGVVRDGFKKVEADVDKLIDAYNSSISPEYYREMAGIGTSLKISYHDVLMANMFYEITGVLETPLDNMWGNGSLARSCTSIVAQRANGTVYLARNQDYPPPFTAIMIHAVFTRGGKTVYEGTTYAGTIGLSTGFVAHSWAASINARDDALKGTAEGLHAALAAARNGAQIGPIFVRQAMDAIALDQAGHAVSTYDRALAYYSSRPLIMPIYITVAGTRPGEGGIITRNATATGTHGLGDYFSLFSKEGKDSAGGDWFTVETNTDHWIKNGARSRRSVAVDGLSAIGHENIDLAGLWKVLDTPPTYNLATIHTDLTCPEWGEYRTYKRHGPLLLEQ